MTLEDVKVILDELSNGAYHTLTYRSITCHTGEVEEECSVYIDEYDICTESNWDEAIAKMTKDVNERITNNGVKNECR